MSDPHALSGPEGERAREQVREAYSLALQLLETIYELGEMVGTDLQRPPNATGEASTAGPPAGEPTGAGEARSPSDARAASEEARQSTRQRLASVAGTLEDLRRRREAAERTRPHIEDEHGEPGASDE